MIHGYLFGDTLAVERFRAASGRTEPELRRSVQRLVLRLTSWVKERKLTGQVLNVRTGRLRRSIHGEVVTEGAEIMGVVGTNVEYARAHELGFRGPVQVKEHLRRAKRGKVRVQAHTRAMHIPERSFLRSALADMRPEIAAEFQRMLREVIR